MSLSYLALVMFVKSLIIGTAIGLIGYARAKGRRWMVSEHTYRRIKRWLLTLWAIMIMAGIAMGLAFRFA